MNDNELNTLNFQNDFKHNNINTAFDLKGSNIENQTNSFIFHLKFDWIFKKYKARDLNFLQFLFLFLSRTILFVFTIAAFLLPLFSINKENISFFEFGGMIVIFIFLCSWTWKKIYENRN